MKTERFCYKWLPILMGCHCRADRSFFFKGKQFPVCARCTGILVGMAAALVSLISPIRPSLLVCVLLILPLIIDGGLQKIYAPEKSKGNSRVYESTNARRFATGLLFGYALIFLIIMFFASAYRTGFAYGLKLFNK